MASHISTNRLSPFGAEATVDDIGNLSSADKQELRALYARDGLLLMRNLNLSMDDQLDLTSVFGPVLRGSRENYLVSNVLEEGLLGNMELRFHSDVPYVPAPYLGGSLHALEVSDGVSGTRFASGFKAYERLPEQLRKRIDGLTALFVRPRVEDRRSRLTDLVPTDNCAVHGVVQRHKDTGRPYIFVNSQSTGCIIGMSESESDELLEELFSYLYDEDNIYEHAWRKGDIVIWDNLALQHGRRAVTSGVRTLQRVAIAEIGYWDQYPVDLHTYEELRQGGGYRPT